LKPISKICLRALGLEDRLKIPLVCQGDCPEFMKSVSCLLIIDRSICLVKPLCAYYYEIGFKFSILLNLLAAIWYNTASDLAGPF
jgi:hypothetical protein